MARPKRATRSAHVSYSGAILPQFDADCWRRLEGAAGRPFDEEIRQGVQDAVVQYVEDELRARNGADRVAAQADLLRLDDQIGKVLAAWQALSPAGRTLVFDREAEVPSPHYPGIEGALMKLEVVQRCLRLPDLVARTQADEHAAERGLPRLLDRLRTATGLNAIRGDLDHFEGSGDDAEAWERASPIVRLLWTINPMLPEDLRLKLKGGAAAFSGQLIRARKSKRA